MTMKNLSILAIFSSIVSFGHTGLIGQSPSAILLENKWESILGNKLKFTTESIFFDEDTIRISWGNTLTLTDSSFLCTQKRWGDTILYFRYKANDDSLMMTFLPNWFRLNQYGSISCSFLNPTFCYLVDRNLTFYSESYLDREKKRFELVYFESNLADHIYYKLFADGNFVFSTKDRAISYANYVDKQNESVKVRVYNGVYKGKLRETSMDTLKTILESNSYGGLQRYLHYSRRPKNDNYSLGISVAGKHRTFDLIEGQIDRLIKTFITFKPDEIFFFGLDGNSPPKPIKVHNNVGFPPPDSYGQKFYNGIDALEGELFLLKTIKAKDTAVYLYRVTVKRFPAKIGNNIKIGQKIAFISPFLIKKEEVGLLYKKQRDYYFNFFDSKESVLYNFVVDTLNFQYQDVYEYEHIYPQGDSITIRTLPKQYPKINIKIAKALKRFETSK